MRNAKHSSFLYQLFDCCCGDKNYIVDRINDYIDNKIEELYKKVSAETLNMVDKKNQRNIFPKQFYKFVEKMEAWKNDTSNPKYCMYEFYRRIAQLNQHLMSLAIPQKNVSQQDIEILSKFYKEYKKFYDREAKAINKKRFEDFLNTIKEGKGLSTTFESWHDFLLNEIFPNYSDQRGGLLTIIRSKSWKEVAFGDLTHQKIIEKYFQNDIRFKQIKKLFKFENIKSDNIKEIRISLVKISNLLDEIYQLENLNFSDEKWDEIKHSLPKYEVIVEDNESDLHLHIKAFMRWLPMLPESESDVKTMESIDNVIDQIRTQVRQILATNDRLKEVLQRDPVNYDNILFLQADAEKLRQLLLNAMYHEPYIRLRFEQFYEVTVS